MCAILSIGMSAFLASMVCREGFSISMRDQSSSVQEAGVRDWSYSVMQLDIVLVWTYFF